MSVAMREVELPDFIIRRNSIAENNNFSVQKKINIFRRAEYSIFCKKTGKNVYKSKHLNRILEELKELIK